MTSSVNLGSAQPQIVHNRIPTRNEIENAKANLLDFLLTDEGNDYIHNMWDFKDMLVSVNSKYITPQGAFDQATGEFFDDLIRMAAENGVLDQSVADVYFAEIDRVAFVSSVTRDFIFYVEAHEKRNGSPVAPADEAIAKVRDEILKHLSKDKEALAQLKNGFIGHAGKTFEQAFIEGYYALFEAFIKNEVEGGRLSKQVEEVCNAPRFRLASFVCGIVQEIHKW